MRYPIHALFSKSPYVPCAMVAFLSCFLCRCFVDTQASCHVSRATGSITTLVVWLGISYEFSMVVSAWLNCAHLYGGGSCHATTGRINLAQLPASTVIWCSAVMVYLGMFNSLRPRQNRRHFADDIFKCIFLNENVWISIKLSLKFVPKGPIDNIPALVQIMAWRRPGDKPLSEPMMLSLLTHICVTRPQCVKCLLPEDARSFASLHKFRLRFRQDLSNIAV